MNPKLLNFMIEDEKSAYRATAQIGSKFIALRNVYAGILYFPLFFY